MIEKNCLKVFKFMLREIGNHFTEQKNNSMEIKDHEDK